MKVMAVFGTRPEIIKLAPVIAALRRRPQRVQTVLLATAQHRGMLDQMMDVFGLKPDVDLNIMRPNQSLEDLTSRLMKEVSGVLSRIKPDLVLVQGDTTTVMVTALAAFYQRIPVGHVEAGLRTGDIYQPFPEEINRRLVSVFARWHFAPTRIAAANLRREGIPASKIFVTGNTVIDALLEIDRRFGDAPLPLALQPGSRLILMTAHRRENFGKPLENICRAILDIVRRYKDVEVVYPMHPNPNVREKAERFLSGKERIHLIEPVDYIRIVVLLKKAHLIITDSGGIQEEAPAFKKPVLVMREVSERPEGIRAGISRLVGTDRNRIFREVSRLLDDPAEYRRMTVKKNPYGDGRAAEKIVSALLKTSSGRSA